MEEWESHLEVEEGGDDRGLNVAVPKHTADLTAQARRRDLEDVADVGQVVLHLRHDAVHVRNRRCVACTQTRKIGDLRLRKKSAGCRMTNAGCPGSVSTSGADDGGARLGDMRAGWRRARTTLEGDKVAVKLQRAI
jgi:hypothetical protein